MMETQLQCDEFEAAFDAWSDGEVSPERDLLMQHHVEQCASCRNLLGVQREFTHALQEAVLQVHAPATLRARILRGDKPEVNLGRRWRLDLSLSLWATAIAAAFMMIFQMGGLDTLGNLGASGIEQASMFEDVVRIHASDLPADVRGDEAQQVSTWFRDKVRFAVRPVTFPGHEAKLVGARLSNVRENRAAALYYNVGGRRITVVVFAPRRPMHRGGSRFKGHNGRELYYRRVNGYVVPVVQKEGVTYALTGDLDPQAQLQLASTVQVQY